MLDYVTSILPPTALYAGLACLLGQVALTLLFRRLPSPWRDEPGFLAHQFVCFPLMLYMCAVGCQGWWLGDSPAPGAARVFDANPTGRHLAEVVLGELAIWDIPTGLLVASLRDPLMVVHHFGMLFIASVALTQLQVYASFFFGVIELSGVFLTIVDVFHPKHPTLNAAEAASPFLQAINGNARILFGLAFLATRVVYFPYVVGAMVIPDALAARGGRVSDGALLTTCVCGVLFTLLQWHWGALIIKQVRKMLAPPEPPMDVRRRASVRHDGPFEDDALAVERTPSEAEVKKRE